VCGGVGSRAVSPERHEPPILPSTHVIGASSMLMLEQPPPRQPMYTSSIEHADQAAGAMVCR